MDIRTKITSSIILIAILLSLVSLFFYLNSEIRNKNIHTFTDCKNAGYKILQSYPPECKTSDGKIFTEDIGNQQEKMDRIQIEIPQPNQKINLPLKIKGKALGSWFFEGSLPIKLVDEGGFLVSDGNAKAVGNWMTEDFVPFTAELSGTLPATKKGILIFERSNPSALPQNADQLELPVAF